jgi:acyl-CoA synthetase (AMP-forming)/AMP-acid ligase II
MAIEMIGGVYCPLSPRDPERRLHTLVQQTQSHLVLVHWMTKIKFSNDIILNDIDSIVTNNVVGSNADIDQLLDASITPNSIAYIIFTSGSTGIPKAVNMIDNIMNSDVINR